MPPMDNPVKCRKCGNENLVHNLTLGKANGSIKTGGPGQDAQLIGMKWAVYLCPVCLGIFPYERFYNTTITLQSIYSQLLDWCDTTLESRNKDNEAISKLQSLIDSAQTLGSLPSFSVDEQIAMAIQPLVDRVIQLEEELKRRKGGRPRKDNPDE